MGRPTKGHRTSRTIQARLLSKTHDLHLQVPFFPCWPLRTEFQDTRLAARGAEFNFQTRFICSNCGEKESVGRCLSSCPFNLSVLSNVGSPVRPWAVSPWSLQREAFCEACDPQLQREGGLFSMVIFDKQGVACTVACRFIRLGRPVVHQIEHVAGPVYLVPSPSEVPGLVEYAGWC